MEKKYIAEFLETFFLVATVIGSGIMGDDLSAGNRDEILDFILNINKYI